MDRRKFKGTTIFGILEQQIKSELQEYRDFVEETSNELHSKINRIEKDLEKIKGTKDEKLYGDILIDEYWKYDKMFSKFTYNPMLLSIYGFFEHWLKRLCEFDNRKGLSNISVSDLAGRNYIEKSRIYFEKVAEIPLSELESDWKRIQIVQQIRNLITHNDSNLFKNDSKKNGNQELFKILKTEEHIEFDEKSGEFYIKHKNFILDLVNIVERYLKTVIFKISKVKVIARNTSLPHNMTSWGQEKSENLIKEVIHGFDMLDRYEERDDEFKLQDTLSIMRGLFETMSWDLTKMLAFFSNGEWQTSDRETIVKERYEGLKKLKELYKN
ncbi:hypothetical protein [Roseivirga sp.]|uniref:hypothetical protein n=1 Tax=Roseivirga sp. TaxID=1964215 RepID=UPI002B26F0F2|nr:hypothetical protein [Roseivirga sp.]